MKSLAILLRRFIYKSLHGLDNLIGRKTQLAILCYHSISDNEWRFSISFREFKKQIDYLAKHYDFVSLEEVENIIANKRKLNKPSIAITFDDGYKDLITTKQILENYNIKPTLFVLSHPDGANREELGTQKELMMDLDLLELTQFGCTIGSHTATHSNLATLDAEQIEAEIVGSKQKLEDELQMDINYIAYPRGKYNDRVIEAVQKAGYHMGLTMDDDTVSTATDPLRVPRIGVDKTHSFEEFKTIMSPSCIAFRRFIKNSFLGTYL
ncbi:MAG: hypothetical protein RI947_844 [Candidatus Parcubacteria bacterium]|jgi:peptidoglycan/xylan/chitin deacetylase (PgdA/CDA1 family)